MRGGALPERPRVLGRRDRDGDAPGRDLHPRLPLLRGPDDEDPTRDGPRKDVLWGVLMAGGAGVEWYAGWQNNAPTSDLSSEDLRVRQSMWRQNRIALDFFDRHVPFQNMSAANDLVAGENDYVLAQPNHTYLVYLRDGGTADLDLSKADGIYDIRWLDPRNGGVLQLGSVSQVSGGSIVNLGTAPDNATQDWATLLRRR